MNAVFSLNLNILQSFERKLQNLQTFWLNGALGVPLGSRAALRRQKLSPKAAQGQTSWEGLWKTNT